MGRIKYKEVAGLEVKRGRPAKTNKPIKSQLKKLYIKESRSIREIAEILGCSKDMVYRSLKEYGIKTRTNEPRSQLITYTLSELENGVKSIGIRGYARELGIDESTLRHHLKVRRDTDLESK